MKLTKPEHIGASQLIPGVGQSEEEETRVPCLGLAGIGADLRRALGRLSDWSYARAARRAAIEALFVGYMGAVLYVTLLPLLVDSMTSGLCGRRLPRPGAHGRGDHPDFTGLVIQQLLGNVVLFVPLGFLLPLLGTRYRRFALTAAVGLPVSARIDSSSSAAVYAEFGQVG